MDTKILEEIGFTNAEIKLYLALLELGSASATPIMEKSRLQSSVTHATLHRLIEKGFVSYIKEGKKHYYQAMDPNHLLEYINEKKSRIEKLVPELAVLKNSIMNKPEVTSFRGKKGVKELLYALLKAEGDEHHTINSPADSLMLGEPFWISYHKKRAELGITAKLIFNRSLVGWKPGHKYPKSELRFSEEGFEPLTETIIRGNLVGLIIWTEKPLGVLFESLAVVDLYEKYFQLLWNSAKPEPIS